MATDRQRYKWDDETKDDSPSEFSTTATYSTSAGALHSAWSHERKKRRRAARRTSLMWAMLVTVGASTLLLYAVSSWLHH